MTASWGVAAAQTSESTWRQPRADSTGRVRAATAKSGPMGWRPWYEQEHSSHGSNPS